jgi:hypothetical protein
MKQLHIILLLLFIVVLFVWFIPLGEGSWMNDNAPVPVLKLLYILSFIVTAPMSRELDIDAPSLQGGSWRGSGERHTR